MPTLGLSFLTCYSCRLVTYSRPKNQTAYPVPTLGLSYLGPIFLTFYPCRLETYKHQTAYPVPTLGLSFLTFYHCRLVTYSLPKHQTAYPVPTLGLFFDILPLQVSNLQPSQAPNCLPCAYPWPILYSCRLDTYKHKNA